jgi:hypothetical protein
MDELDSYSGNKYVGEYMDGKRHGKGALTQSNGSKYEGSYSNEKWNGNGLLIKANGSKYEGEFLNGYFYNGFANETDPYSGEKFVGQYRNGKRMQ